MSNDNKKICVLILCAIIGLGFIIYGIVQMVKISNYVKTTGQFSYSSLEESTDSDGNTSSYYIYYYNFTVNNEEYLAKSDSEISNEPFNKEEKILYNPQNPNENLLGTDYTRYIVIIVGIIFLSTAVFFMPKKYDYIPNVSDTQYNGWFMLMILICFSLIIFMKANFNVITLLTTMLLPTIMIFGFFCACIFLFKKQSESKIENFENTTNSDTWLNNANQAIDEEKMQKAQDIIYKIKGIRQIVLGIVWCLFVFAQEIISAIAVLISFVCGNSTYTYNGEKVTAIQFIFGQVSIFQLIMFAFGILIIALGIRDLASYKKR